MEVLERVPLTDVERRKLTDSLKRNEEGKGILKMNPKDTSFVDVVDAVADGEVDEVVERFPSETWDGFSAADIRQLILDSYDELIVRREMEDEDDGRKVSFHAYRLAPARPTKG